MDWALIVVADYPMGWPQPLEIVDYSMRRSLAAVVAVERPKHSRRVVLADSMRLLDSADSRHPGQLVHCLAVGVANQRCFQMR
jgi:hypothetical protein